MPSRSGSSAGGSASTRKTTLSSMRHQLGRHVVEGVLDDRVELLVGQRLHVTTLSLRCAPNRPCRRQPRGARSRARPGPCSGAPRQRAVTVPSAQRSSSECGRLDGDDRRLEHARRHPAAAGDPGRARRHPATDRHRRGWSARSPSSTSSTQPCSPGRTSTDLSAGCSVVGVCVERPGPGCGGCGGRRPGCRGRGRVEGGRQPGVGVRGRPAAARRRGGGAAPPRRRRAPRGWSRCTTSRRRPGRARAPPGRTGRRRRRPGTRRRLRHIW